MKLGTVISNKSGMYVITQISNGGVVDTEPLKLYISENVMIEYNGA